MIRLRSRAASGFEGETDRCVLKSGDLAAGCLVRLSCTGLKAKGSVRAQN